MIWGCNLRNRANFAIYNGYSLRLCGIGVLSVRLRYKSRSPPRKRSPARCHEYPYTYRACRPLARLLNANYAPLSLHSILTSSKWSAWCLQLSSKKSGRWRQLVSPYSCDVYTWWKNVIPFYKRQKLYAKCRLGVGEASFCPLLVVLSNRIVGEKWRRDSRHEAPCEYII